MRRAFSLPFNERRRLHERAFRAQRRDHREVCGVIATGPNRRISLHFLRNWSDRPGHFELAHSELRRLRGVLRRGGERFMGIFHSHVVGTATPGAGDLAGAWLSHLQLIYDVCGREARLWRVIRSGRRLSVREVPLITESRSLTRHWSPPV
jgi:proteasome lid subunit RPN8/RPN11